MVKLNIEVEDNILEKVISYLEQFKEVKIKNKKELFINETKKSYNDLLVGNYEEIKDIKSYVKNLNENL